MGKIEKRMQPWAFAAVAHLAGYIEKGDPEALAKAKRTKGYQQWRAELCKAMDPPSKIDEEDRRTIHVLTACGGYVELRDWLSLDLAREKPEEDLHGMLRSEMAHGGLSEKEIAFITLAYYRDFQKGG